MLCDLRDMSTEEAAAELGISPGNLRVRATRARARIRVALTDLDRLGRDGPRGCRADQLALWFGRCCLYNVVMQSVVLAVLTATPAVDLGLYSAPVQVLLRQRWRRHPSCAGATSLATCMPALERLEIVTPVSLRRDRQLTLIASSYPAAVR